MPVPAIDRALTVLEMLAASHKPLSLAEISRNLGVNRSSAHYIMGTLEARGYVQRGALRGNYSIAAKLFGLANVSLTGLEIRSRAAPHLRKLVERISLTVHLTILSAHEAVIVDRVAAPSCRSIPTWIGKRMPIHCTGAGKALLAWAPSDRVDACVQRGFVRYNDNTIVPAPRFRQELAAVRARGYSLDDEEETIGLRCIGAPVLGPDGHSVAAVSVSGTTTEIDEGRLERLAKEVVRAAVAITASDGDRIGQELL